MSPSAQLTSVHFTPASAANAASGLIGYLQLGVGDLFVIDGVTLRRTRDGRMALSYPNPGNRRRAPVRPLDDEARRAIEAAVFEALGLEASP